jgi:hypothetical protein
MRFSSENECESKRDRRYIGVGRAPLASTACRFADKDLQRRS